MIVPEGWDQVRPDVRAKCRT